MLEIFASTFLLCFILGIGVGGYIIFLIGKDIKNNPIGGSGAGSGYVTMILGGIIILAMIFNFIIAMIEISKAVI